MAAPRLFVRCLAAGLVCAAGCTDDTSMFHPASTPAASIVRFVALVLAITGVIFVVVGGLIVYATLRFRAPAQDDGREPPQIYGSGPVELAWTTVPVLIVVVLFLTTARVIHEVQDEAKPANAFEVTVIGRQWWWEFRYPKQGVVTANELHVPVDAPTFLTLLSADVAHSFWVPRLAGKTDVIPNRVNTMWIAPQQTGLFLGQCAEYCGTQHAKMLLRVYVHPRAEFEKWAEEQRRIAAKDPSVAEGRLVFERTACVNCHALNGIPAAAGRFGPDLTHLMSRETIASGAVRNTRENLKLWIRNPDSLKPGCLMPAMNLVESDLDRLVAYLETLR